MKRDIILLVVFIGLFLVNLGVMVSCSSKVVASDEKILEDEIVTHHNGIDIAPFNW